MIVWLVAGVLQNFWYLGKAEREEMGWAPGHRYLGECD